MIALEVIEPMPVARIKRDIAQAATLISDAEARYLVDTYYQVQDFRKAAGNQGRALAEQDEPNLFIGWTFDTMEYIESQIKRALDRYTDQQTVGVWAKSIVGIGPVIAAGLLAHIDIERAPTVGHIWRYAGLDPTVVWAKGQKRPWNADLKRLCWLIGESFVKFSNHPDDTYGKVYRARKEQEIARNCNGDFAAQAEVGAARVRATTDAYKAYSEGRLPDAQIHARAKRYAVKLFLSHLHHVMYEDHYGTPPPKPYIIQHGGHVDFIAPPNWPL